MAEPTSGVGGTWKENKIWKMVFSVVGIMATLVTYGILQVSSFLFPILNFIYFNVLCRWSLLDRFCLYYHVIGFASDHMCVLLS